VNQQLEFQIDASAILNYKRLDYSFWFALAEYVDNSTQSYINNKELLDDQFKRDNESLEVKIIYDNKRDTLTIRDNAMGMNFEELAYALQMGKPPANNKGRSEFGMGLKTASCWIGDTWTVRTKKLGDEEEVEFKFDVEKVSRGEVELPHIRRKKPKDDHYTIVEIHQMHQKIAGATITKTKNYLASMYRVDIKDNSLILKWGEEPLSYIDKITFLKAQNGEEFRKDFSFKVGNHLVTGWGGILEKGGRAKAGFAIIRRNRVIQGQPTAWRPTSIYGQEGGSNDLINQRLIGEVHLDSFMVSHTKNAILFQGDEEHVIEEKLLEEFSTYLDIAQDSRYRTTRIPIETITLGLAAAVEQMQSAEFIDAVALNEVLPANLIEAENQPVIESMKTGEATHVLRFSDFEARIFLKHELSPSDPYFLPYYSPDDRTISVAINTKHPFFTGNLDDTNDVLIYCVLSCLDAIAEWKCLQKTGEINSKTVNNIKNDLMKHISLG
jgi:hypothetical protein